MSPLTRGANVADDLADRGREDVDAADDQHVVGAPDAADADPGAPARARARADVHVVAGAEAQQRRGAVLEVREHELALRAVHHRDRRARRRVDQLGLDELGRAEVHPVLRLALAPERDADVADAHRLGDARAPAGLEPRAEGRLAAARLARHEHAPDGGGREVDPPLRGPLDARTRRTRASSRPPRARGRGSRARAARCSRSRPARGRARCGRRPRAPRPPRTGRRCR